MRLPTVMAGVALAMTSGAMAYPGYEDTMGEIRKLQGRASTSLIGDLQELDDDQLTSTGKDIKELLTGSNQPQDLKSKYDSVPPKDSAACAKDTCCIWKYIAEDMRDSMLGSAGRCNNLARQAIRLGFHDAGAWSKATGRVGGADGSIVLAGECEQRKENRGMSEICSQMRVWHDKYKSYGVGMADLVQFGANVGTVVCPLGPRVRTFVGRKDSSEPGPTGLLPSPFASADKLISMFEDKTISPAGLVALVGAHTVSQQEFVYPEKAGNPQDSTPGVWDSRFYKETSDKNSPVRVTKLESDVNLSLDPRTSGTWRSYSGAISGQILFNQAYSREYIRLSLLGVYNINDLTECTKALPNFFSSFDNPDKDRLSEFLAGGLDFAADALFKGDKIPDK